MKNWQFIVLCSLIVLCTFITVASVQSKPCLTYGDFFPLDQRVQLIDTNVRVIIKNQGIINQNLENKRFKIGF